MERIRRISAGSYSISVRAADADGVLVTPATPALTVLDGSGATAYTGTPAAALGLLSAYVPAADLDLLDTYSCSWSGTVAGATLEWPSTIEIAGGYLFEIADLRASDPALADTVKYPGAACRAARTAAEERFEGAARVAFVPRGRRVTLRGDGSYRLELPDNACRRVVSVSIDGTALDAGALAELELREWGALDRPSLWPAGSSIAVYYEHGEDAPPAPVREAAMLLAREYLVRSAISSRAVVEQTDVGAFRLSVAGRDRPTGIPDVDAVIEAFGRRRPRIA